MSQPDSLRNLILVLGDQLDFESSAFDEFDKGQDVVWMAEVKAESTYSGSSKQRTTLFLSAMRHFREMLKEQRVRVFYTELDDKKNKSSLGGQLSDTLSQKSVSKVVCAQPGEYRLLEELEKACKQNEVDLEIREDTHFLASPQDFKKHAEGRKQLRMEYFYREMRKRYQVLLDDNQPIGGKWNYDASNRKSFGRSGPKELPIRTFFEKDEITDSVIQLVEKQFPDHPGSAAEFRWPVNRKQALQALEHFTTDCLSHFGQYQDAMWQEEPFLYHSLIASSLNLKLLNPREVIHAAEQAYHDKQAPLEAVEGFIRQILGWREYVRGIYWHYMPEYLERNALQAKADLPDFYWTGESDMNCLNNCISQTLKYGYAHHIQRLMVTGLFSLLYGVNPKQIHQWYLAVYVDAVEWVELPNTLGMSQYGDGGAMASKPYIASGKYIQRMSNYCSNCQYDPAESTGERACPFTTLYWNFLIEHQSKLQSNNRMGMQLRNLERLSEEKKEQIVQQSKAIHQRYSESG